MIDTVIFDLGKVLVDFDNRKGMRKMGFSEETIELFCNKIFSGPWEHCDQVTHTLESIQSYFLEFVPGYEKEVFLLFERCTDLTGVRPYTHELLHILKDKGLKLYILSNYGNVSYEINRQIYDFLPLFDGGVISYEVNMIKPDLRIYQYLLDKYSLIPENSIFVDDRLENVLAAERLGIHGVHFTGYPEVLEKINVLLEESKK